MDLPFVIKFINNAQRKILETNPGKYKAALKQGGKHLPDWDNAFLQDDDILEATVMQNREAYRQGVDGALYESKLMTIDWGFQFQNISVPIHVWHGESDTLSPISEMKAIVQHLPKVKTHFIENGGHFLTEDEELWEAMLAVVKG